MIRITKFRCNAFEEISYLVWTGKACALIDPGFDSEEEFASLYGTMRQNGIRPSAILLTHAHPDHVYGAGSLAGEFGCRVYANYGEKVTLAALHGLCENIGHADVEDFSGRTVWIHDSDRIVVTADGVRTVGAEDPAADVEAGDSADGKAGSEDGVLEFKVLLTPGHSAGGVCYLCRELQAGAGGQPGPEDGWKVLFSGDTLFAGCIGRSDLPGGDYDTLMHSIFSKLLCLDGGIDVLPGHGRATTVADERMKNPFLQPFNEPFEDE